MIFRSGIFRSGALMLGFLLLAYWGRVIRMAYKARRQTGRAGNLIPPEPLGRMLRLIWTPVILVWIAQPFLTAIASRPPFLWRPFYSIAAFPWLSAAIVAAAFAVTWRCWKQMGRAWRMGIDPGEQTTLITTGPFARVRHPIYGLSQAMMLATLLALPSPLLLAAAIIHVTLLQWESRREESHLLKLHGEPYAQYRAATGRFVPKARLSPHVNDAKGI
jgi:protein-S-isoprenylcysteine O-methyltransferase Ste14